jgi:hypothetical protein
LSEGQRFKVEFKKKMKQEAGMAETKQKMENNPITQCGCCIHELNDLSSNEDSSQWSEPTNQINVRK